MTGTKAVVEPFARAKPGFLFTAAGVVYLLVRRDVDRIELDNVHAPGQEMRYALPPLTHDEAGVPGVDERAEN